jgi:hypothetical protein
VPYYLFWPEKETLILKGYAGIADVPCIFDDTWKYHKIASRYLRERATGQAGFITRRFPTRQSLETFGRYLCNFLEWCELRGIPWKKIKYKEDVVDGYQRQMLSGAWSASANGLSKKTVNNRVDEACRFLQWAVDRDLRDPFKIIVFSQKVQISSAFSSNSHKFKEIGSRVGKVRPDPLRLSMPKDDDVVKWLNSVSIEKGPTKALMCELILRTGIRREECVQWRITTLPKERAKWKLRGQYVVVTVE